MWSAFFSALKHCTFNALHSNVAFSFCFPKISSTITGSVDPRAGATRHGKALVSIDRSTVCYCNAMLVSGVVLMGLPWFAILLCSKVVASVFWPLTGLLRRMCTKSQTSTPTYSVSLTFSRKHISGVVATDRTAGLCSCWRPC